ncbi:Niemann-Pick C1 protein [Armadillidium vulgare]|nr:Niemann-Pick C1 protein [Armadillidium vulgare]
MAYHGVLKNSKDYTNALDEAYKLTDYMNSYIRNNSLTPHVEIFPYSVFYVFYEQYLDMWRSLAISLSVSAAAVFLVMYLITGFDLKSSVINLLVIVMIVVDIMAMMVPWNIQLNPISLVNLVMAIGISVEFCNHVTHSFVTSAERNPYLRNTPNDEPENEKSESKIDMTYSNKGFDKN